MPKLASMWVKMLMVRTDCSGERQEMAPTFRMSMNIAHECEVRGSWEHARAAGKQEPGHHGNTDQIGDERTRRDAAHAKLRDRAEAQAERAAKNDLANGRREHHERGQLMLPVPRKMPDIVFISHGNTAPPKNICV